MRLLLPSVLCTVFASYGCGARIALTSDGDAGAIVDAISAPAMAVEWPAALAHGAIVAIGVSDPRPGRALGSWLRSERVGDPLPVGITRDAPQSVVVAPLLSAALVIDWRRSIAGRAIFAAPTPVSFDSRRETLWVAHGSLTGVPPTASRAGTEQHAWIDRGSSDDAGFTPRTSEALDAFIDAHKREVGVTELPLRRVSDGRWIVDDSRVPLTRDATDATRGAVVGRALSEALFDDRGAPLAPNEFVGVVTSSCGARAPWGAMLFGEREVARLFGELEGALDQGGLIAREHDLVASSGFAPNAEIAPIYASHGGSDFGRVSEPRRRQSREAHGYVIELDSTPGVRSSANRALGALGRADWRSIAFAPVHAGAPIVLYALDGRGGGTLFKFVSRSTVEASDSPARLRARFFEGRVYVAQVEGLASEDRRTVGGRVPTAAAPAVGRWIELSLSSTDTAPIDAGRTVRDVLRDPSAAGLGAFASDDLVRAALVTAARKIGVSPLDGARSIALDPSSGRLLLAMHGLRNDRRGSINALLHRAPAHSGGAFEWTELWHGVAEPPALAARNPASIAVDRDGIVWFATECEFGDGACEAREALYALDVLRAASSSAASAAVRVALAPVGAAFSAPTFDETGANMFVGVHQRAGSR